MLVETQLTNKFPMPQTDSRVVNFGHLKASELSSLFCEVTAFPPMPEPDANDQARIVSKNGLIAIESCGSKVTVFVQIQGVNQLQAVQNATVLILLLQHHFPIWKGEAKWINSFVVDNSKRLDGLSTRTHTLQFRKTGAGIFVDIEPKLLGP